ncbi:MAG: RsmG family class I SAM-dependent methyltransferase [Lentisphaeria bacterium]|nr:RsmG family class I SAM-dependent methyltransferase [Lentisphaeria bacterium]
MNTVPESVLAFLDRCGIPPLNQAALAPLIDIRRRLEIANAEINLTRVVSADNYWVKHIADSLSIGLIFPEIWIGKLVLADVGCGGGFPLLPLAWAAPHARLTGIDTARKKIDFVNTCCDHLGWTHCRGVTLQAREAGRKAGLASAFDVVVSRAMSDCARVFKECRGLLKPTTGRLILYKTPDLIAKETASARREADKFGYMFSASESFHLPLNAGARQFAVFTPVVPG